MNQTSKILCLLATSATLLFGCLLKRKSMVTLSPERMYAAEGYKLVWADEFNKEGGPDTTSWRYEKGFVRNQELQWYQEENAWSERGYLVIEARREQRPNPLYQAGRSDWR